MKVFLSWSGGLSLKVANALRDWLPMVLQHVKPYVSAEDIDKGTRWGSDIAQELNESAIGILCITLENGSAPWINFEAGALSKTIDRSLVCPFLIGMKRADIDAKSPLLQFQSTVYEKDDVKRLLTTLNGASEKDQIDPGRLDEIFVVWWPLLQSKLDLLLEETAQSSATKEDSDPKSVIMLEEILDLTRSQQRLLGRTVSILEDQGSNTPSPWSPSAWADAMRYLHEFRDFVGASYGFEMDHDYQVQLIMRFNKLVAPLGFINQRMKGGRERVPSVEPIDLPSAS